MWEILDRETGKKVDEWHSADETTLWHWMPVHEVAYNPETREVVYW